MSLTQDEKDILEGRMRRALKNAQETKIKNTASGDWKDGRIRVIPIIIDVVDEWLTQREEASNGSAAR